MSKDIITVYSPVWSERLSYACHVIFKIVLNREFQIIQSLKDFILSDNELLINYTDEPIGCGFQIIPSGLLFETDIHNQLLSEGKYENMPVLYYSGKGNISYDIFSAVFYMISRYEEYLDFEPDQYGRFKAEDSTAYQLGFNHLPVVEMWAFNLADKLQISTEDIIYRHLLTVDIDNAWMFKNKGFLRTYGGIAMSLLKGRIHEAGFRIKVITGRKKDPADNFTFLQEIGDKLEQHIQYFILVGQKRPYDNALSVNHPEYKKLLMNLADKFQPGFHPSYESNKDFKILSKEYLSLCSIFIRPIVKSRQHYLKIRFPDTFRNLMQLSICEDYSLGWSSQIGFRAGISRPFPFFDLVKNKQTRLIFVPFMVMDRTLKDYLNLSPDVAIKQVKKICDEVKQVKGQFTVLWHNDSLSDSGEWSGWKKVFEETVLYGERN